ncbi:hypothetical protein NDU88_002862 [Pleurodeles waltl]|uniref:Uncharacterized protein n=1 Tax=Pleurodeles waltl TaxID=8319 RepID=A0AAV7SF62_PLEWA|nr:hypothetical protein NDU88_002862 [Pleurodeles waltl]
MRFSLFNSGLFRILKAHISNLGLSMREKLPTHASVLLAQSLQGSSGNCESPPLPSLAKQQFRVQVPLLPPYVGTQKKIPHYFLGRHSASVALDTPSQILRAHMVAPTGSN